MKLSKEQIIIIYSQLKRLIATFGLTSIKKSFMLSISSINDTSLNKKDTLLVYSNSVSLSINILIPVYII